MKRVKMSLFDLEVSPQTDGLDHIRVGLSGKTILGRMLSPVYHLPLTHRHCGNFASMEAYWQWIRSGMDHCHLKELHGERATLLGNRHLRVHHNEFRAAIIEGVTAQISQNKQLSDLLCLSKLPLIEYARLNGDTSYVLEHGHDWYYDAISVIRAQLLKSLPRIKTIRVPKHSAMESAYT
jgi:hypothetical protein